MSQDGQVPARVHGVTIVIVLTHVVTSRTSAQLSCLTQNCGSRLMAAYNLDAESQVRRVFPCEERTRLLGRIVERTVRVRRERGVRNHASRTRRGPRLCANLAAVDGVTCVALRGSRKAGMSDSDVYGTQCGFLALEKTPPGVLCGTRGVIELYACTTRDNGGFDGGKPRKPPY
ncbi:hypothetical protein VTO73DRAFT_5344 [Trametes versicolor]